MNLLRSVTRSTTAVLIATMGIVSLPACHQDELAAVEPDTSSLGGGSTAAEAKALTTIAKALLSFHTDTGGWPYGETAWYAITPAWRPTPDPQINPGQFTPFDTALFALPPDILTCDATHTGGWHNPCWNGPYLSGAETDALGSAPWLDQWGHARLFTYIRPNDGLSGGVDQPESQYGAVFVWSMGPDGKDGFGCSDGSCKQNWNLIVDDKPSQANADDIVVEVSETSCATPTCIE